jgi:transcriptional regulator with XRE-family HTH domain
MDPIADLRKRIDRASLRTVAKELGISAPYLSDIMRGQRKPGPKVLGALGMERQTETVVTYRRKRSPNGNQAQRPA